MKVSIITVCYNSAATIEDTIKSVLAQTYTNIEYIIIDGVSTDNTLDVIEPYKDRIAKVVSEPDKGMYDACNKGIKMATGDIVAILNADDIYASPYVIEKIVKQFEEKDCEALYGDLQYVAHDDLTKLVRHWRSGKFSVKKFLFGWMPPHPTFFVKRSVYEKYGFFDTTFRSAADYEYMLRVLFKYRVNVDYIPEVIVLMRQGGMSNATLKNRIRANKEDQLAWKVNGLKSYFFTLWMKPVRKIPQFLFSRFYNVNMSMTMRMSQNPEKVNNY